MTRTEKQEQIVYNHLKKYGSITKLEAMQKYNITNLGEKIRVLRNKGIEISTIMVPTKDKSCHYAKYVLTSYLTLKVA